MAQSDIFIEYPYELFSYMRENRKPVFHNSNIFLRDLQYAIQDYFEDKQGLTLRGERANELALEVARAYERDGIFKRVNPQGYLLNYPELSTPKDGGTIAGLQGIAPDEMLPPPKAAAAPAPAAKPAAAPAAAATAAPAAAKPAAAPAAAAGATPAGAKAPPPWLKK